MMINKSRIFLFILTYILLSQIVLAQNQHAIDSFKNIIINAKHDTTQIKAYLKIGDNFEFSHPDTALNYYFQALEIAIKNTEDKELEKLDEKSQIEIVFFSLHARTLNYIGNVYSFIGKNPEAISYFQESVKMYENLGFIIETTYCYNNIGLVHWDLGDFNQAIDYFTKSLKTIEDYCELEEYKCDKNGIAMCCNNIGLVMVDKEDYNQAIKYYERALKIYQDLEDKVGTSRCYNNIGNVFYEQDNFNKAIEHYKQSLSIKIKLGDKNGMAISLGNIASSLLFLKKYHKAIDYAEQAVHIAKDIKAIYWIRSNYNRLSTAYDSLGNYKKAYQYQKLFKQINDSIFNVKSSEQIKEMEARFQNEKKQFQIKNLEKDKQLQQESIKRQQILIYSFLIGFLIIITFSILLYRQFMAKKQANILLEKQNYKIKTKNIEISAQKEEIEAQRDEIEAQRDRVIEQKEHIEEQKEEIEDSIHYAKRIQTAVLPSETYVNSILGKHFILFRPHSVVSGDFYWATKTEHWTIITASDCTGHGVPGAFMSMLGVSFLNEIVQKNRITNAAEILNQLRISIIKALKQTGEEGSQQDGMDMSIIAINLSTTKTSNVSSKKESHTKLQGISLDGRNDKDSNHVYQAQWAGANNPLYIISKKNKNEKGQILAIKNENSNLYEIKPNKMPVAVYLKMNDFTNHEIELNKGDKIYMFSDGFPDQFDGPKGKKFKNKQFKQLLLDTSKLSMIEQGEQIEKTFDEWVNWEGQEYEQIDDVTVLGIKI